jgi:hypothetical protein
MMKTESWDGAVTALVAAVFALGSMNQADARGERGGGARGGGDGGFSRGGRHRLEGCLPAVQRQRKALHDLAATSGQQPKKGRPRARLQRALWFWPLELSFNATTKPPSGGSPSG